MTPFVVTNAALSQLQLNAIETKTTQFEKMAASDKAPWLYSALAQLHDLEVLGQSVAGLGDLRIREDTANRARMLLSHVNILDLPAPTVAPVSGGAVSIIWSTGPKEVKYALYPDGEASFFKIADEDIVADGTVQFGDPSKICEPLSWMLDQRL